MSIGKTTPESVPSESVASPWRSVAASSPPLPPTPGSYSIIAQELLQRLKTALIASSRLLEGDGTRIISELPDIVGMSRELLAELARVERPNLIVAPTPADITLARIRAVLAEWNVADFKGPTAVEALCCIEQVAAGRADAPLIRIGNEVRHAK